MLCAEVSALDFASRILNRFRSHFKGLRLTLPGPALSVLATFGLVPVPLLMRD